MMKKKSSINRQARLRAEQAFGRQISTLLKKVCKEIKPPQPADALQFMVSMGLIIKAMESYKAVQSLIRAGYSDDAFALVRSLTEKILNACYIILNGSSAARDYMDYIAVRQWRDYQDLKRTSPEMVAGYSPERVRLMEQAYEKAKDKLFPDGTRKSRYGRGNDWTTLSLFERAQEIDRHLARHRGHSEAGKAAALLHRATYAKSSAFTHGTFLILASLYELKGLEVTIRVPPDELRTSIEALYAANLVIFFAILFVDEKFLAKKYLTRILAMKDQHLRAIRGN